MDDNMHHFVRMPRAEQIKTLVWAHQHAVRRERAGDSTAAKLFAIIEEWAGHLNRTQP
jgi:hypothetical protein